ncbi:CPBP family glutamic-type intramembrane protease [candidate division KSB1 bacterium]|nr:CPBP family glutamic-type intramembrane protease [candidate division KSB1 bacterium]
MHLKKTYVVFRKELIDTLRDRRTLTVMVLVPILLYPLLFAVLGQIMSAGMQQLEDEKSRVAYIPEIPPEFEQFLTAAPKIDLLVSPNPALDLQQRQLQAYLMVKSGGAHDTIFVYYDAAVDRSRQAQKRIQDLLQQYRQQLQEQKLIQARVDISILAPFAVREINTAPPARMGGMLLGAIVPLLLIVTLMLGAMYPAIDLTAGEKERGTLETILTVPIQKLELLLGKFFTVTTIALITGVLNLVSMWLAYALGFIQMGMINAPMEFSFSPLALAVLLIQLIPLALFLSAAILSVCIFARSFKDAQNFVTPLYLLLIFPALFASMPGMQINGLLASIPLLNVSLLFKEILLNNFDSEIIFTVFISNTVFAFLSILIFSKLFYAEEILLGEGKGWQFRLNRAAIEPMPFFQPGSAFIILALIFILLFYFGSLAQLKFSHWGILATEWLLILLPVLGALLYNKVQFRTALNLRSFRLLALVGMLCMVLGGMGVVIWISQWQIKLFPAAEKIGEILEKILNLKQQGIPVGLGIFIFAVSPAICEEVLFRGILLSALKPRLSATLTISLVALLFGLFHLQIFRLLPTALIGVYLTYVVYYSGSIWLSMIGHALNNGLALLILAYPELFTWLQWLNGLQPLPLGLAGGLFILLLAGGWLVRLSSRRQAMS